MFGASTLRYPLVTGNNLNLGCVSRYIVRVSLRRQPTNLGIAETSNY